jgi:hypothetical protein
MHSGSITGKDDTVADFAGLIGLAGKGYGLALYGASVSLEDFQTTLSFFDCDVIHCMYLQKIFFICVVGVHIG